MAEKPEDIDTHIRGLLKTATELHDEIYGKNSSRQHTLWMVRTSNFFSAYSKANNPNGFKRMFIDFYSLNTPALTSEIFIEEDRQTVVNDRWLAIEDNLEQPAPRKSASLAASVACAGLVIYPDPQRRSVSIPLSEIYLEAKAYAKKKGTKDMRAYAFPIRILHHFFAVLHYAIPDLDAEKPKITRNMTALKSFLAEITPAAAPSSGDAVGEGIAGFSKIMAEILKASKLDGAVDTSQLEGTMRSALSGDAVKSVGKVVGKIMSSVKGSDGDVGSVLDGIGSALKDPEIRGMLATSAKETAALAASVPTATNPKGEPIPESVLPIPMVEDQE